MSFPGTISAGNITKCRGSFAGAQYLSLCPNTVVYKTTINGAPTVISPGNSVTYFTVGATISGNPASVRADQRVLIGAVDDIRQATYDGRVRKAIAGTTFAISETSIPLSSGMYVWVLDDYVLTDKLAFLSLGFQYKDYDLSYRGLPPVISGLQSWYVGWVTGSPARFTVAFSASAVAAESGATISSYLYVTPDGTVTAGSLSTANVTIAFPEGYRTVHLTVTDSGSRTMTRHIKVYAHSADYPPALDFSGAQINHTVDGGQSISAESWAGTSTLLDKTSCCGWTQEYYNDTEGPIVNNIVFVGRMRQTRLDTKADLVYSAVQAAQWTIESPAEQLSHVQSQSRALIPDSTPTIWDEINALTVWRAVVYLLAEHSTFLNLHDLTFDSTDTTYLIPQVGLQKGDLLRSVQDLIESINGHWEWAPSGESRIYRDNRYLTTAARNARTTVYGFTSADWMDLSFSIDPAWTAGVVNGSGATYNSTTGQESPYLAMSPGTAPTEAPEEIPFPRQYLSANLSAAAAKAELITRTANRFAIEQKKIKATLVLPDGYRWLTPTGSDWYTITCAATDNQLGLVYTTATRWLLESVSSNWDNQTGTCGPVTATFTIETSGTAGVAFEPPTASEEPYVLPDIPTFDPYADLFPTLPDLLMTAAATAEDELPDDGVTLRRDGSVQILIDPTNALADVTRNGLAPTPTYSDVTPTFAANEAPKTCVFDPLSSGNDIGAYQLTSDVTNSWVHHCASAFAGIVTWAKGAALTGEYNVLRASGTSQTILAYAPNAPGVGTQAAVYTVSFESDGYPNYLLGYQGAQNDVTTGGNPGNCAHVSADSNGGNTTGVMVTVTLPFVTHITSVAWDIKRLQGGTPNIGLTWNYYDADGAQLSVYSTTVAYSLNTWYTPSHSPNLDGVKSIRIVSANTNVGTVEVLADNIVITGTIPSLTAGAVATSTDAGATWASPRAVGVSVLYEPAGGFDVQRAGGNSYAAGDGAVYQATTLGGTYSSYYTPSGSAQAACIIVPWFTWAGVNQMGATDCDIVIGLTIPDASSRTLIWLENDGTTEHDLTPVAGMTFDNPDAFTCLYQHHLACFGLVSGAYHVYTSNNRGSTWVDRGAVTSPTYIRCRRGDNSASVSGTNKGQLFCLANHILRYSPDWGVTWKTRNPPGAMTKMDMYG